jgi:hypothetical protein
LPYHNSDRACLEEEDCIYFEVSYMRFVVVEEEETDGNHRIDWIGKPWVE